MTNEPDPQPPEVSDPEIVAIASDTGIIYSVVRSALTSHGLSIT